MDLQSMESVVGPLNEGIVSISNIYTSLLDAHVDPSTDICSNYKQIREHIKNAEQCLKKSEIMIKEKLEHLDDRMEQLIKDKENAEQQKKEKCMTKHKLKIEKNSAEESLKYSKAALEQAKKKVSLTKEEIKREEDRKETAGWETAAGIAVTLIPFAGWIAGPILIYDGVKAMDNASKAISDAEDELEENKSLVNESSMKVSNYQSKISTIQKEIEKTYKVLNKIQRETEEVQQHLEVTADIQHRVRKAVNLLSVLSGRITVLERQTQRFILWNPVINLMENVMKAVGYVADNQILYSQGLPGLIDSLRETVGELQALCNSPSSSEFNSYY